MLSIKVDDVNGFDDTIVSGFLEKIGKYGVKPEDIDVVSRFSRGHTSGNVCKDSTEGIHYTNWHDVCCRANK